MTTRTATTTNNYKCNSRSPSGMTTRTATTTATTSATTDPPFDYAQGRLFGDDNKKKGKDYSYV
jgi:hypothetical protein